MMDEVIKKLIYFYWFHQPYTFQRCTKNKTEKYDVRLHGYFYGAQSIKNAAETYNIFFRGFFGWVKYGKKMLRYFVY